MDVLKLHLFIIVLWLIYITQNSFVESTKTVILNNTPIAELEAKRKACVDEIQEVFLEENQNHDRKFYAKQAFLYLRISNLPECDTFTFNVKDTNPGQPSSSSLSTYKVVHKEDAKAYYEYIFPFIKVQDKIESINEFCIRYAPEGTVIFDTNSELADSRVVHELKFYFPKTVSSVEMISYIYFNMEFEKFVEYHYVQEYFKSLVNYFEPDLVMDLPSGFCADRYP